MINTIFNSGAHGKSGFAAQDLLGEFANVSDGLTNKVDLGIRSDMDNTPV